MKSMLRRFFLWAVIILVVIGAGFCFLTFKHLLPSREGSKEAVSYKTSEEKNDVYVRFAMEGFDTILTNYWQKVDAPALAEHFQVSLKKALENAKIATPEPTLLTKDRAGAAQMLSSAFAHATKTSGEKQLALDTLVVALYNIPPIGRNGILSTGQETSFRENVSNIDKSKDLYKNLGLEKGASASDVKKAYEEKVKVLGKQNTPEAKAELEKIAYAKDVLANPNTKDLYDEAQIEPTLSSRIMGKTLYVKMGKIAPTTLLEFGRTVYSATTTPGLDSMIIDLRGNLGGALDFAQNFLGLFLGQNQFAFDLFHQGDYNVQRTAQAQFPELSRYKEIAVLTDNMTQSTAEVTSAAFKRFKLGTVIGETTRGWGTVENTFPLKTEIDPTQKYSLLLVHSITLREDNQPTEGRGIDPDISIKDPNWKNKLSSRFTSVDLIKAIKTVFAE